MATPAPDGNILAQVVTYNEEGMALLLNTYSFVNLTNKDYDQFNDTVPKNLGSTISFTKPPRITSADTLIAQFQAVEERIQYLTVDNEISASIAFTAEQFIFNTRQFIDKFGRSAIATIGTKIEANLAQVAEQYTYRFYGDAVTPINSFLQLSTAVEQLIAFGAAHTDFVGILSNLTYPPIVNSGLNQFAPDRNDDLALAWKLGEFNDCRWFRSNLIRKHVSGTEGNQGSTLTVVATTTDANGGVVGMTLSGTHAASDPNSVKQYDKARFNDGVAGFNDIRFLTWIGYEQTELPVQFQITANAASTSGSEVTISIFPPLQAAQGRNQNVSENIVPGMQISILPNHRCGLLMSGNPMYSAMPKLPDQTPFETSIARDDDSGCTIRMYYGNKFGENFQGIIQDGIWARTLVSEYCMMVALPY